jgi:(R,R)-butanediol dehydrogenase / meso-butanediol dehydrogenase / diacetyl reductase
VSARHVSYTAPRTLELRASQEADAAPPPGHVALDVAYTGICGTDLHIFHGAMDNRVDPPCVIGHEMSGRITRSAADVTGWQAGDHVTVMPLVSCGQCPACRCGHGHICHRLVFLGIDAAGSMQTRWTVPASTLVRLPHDLPLDHAALTEPTAVAVHDVRRARLRPDEKVLVVGGGPIGVLIALVARDRCAGLLLVEPDPYRRGVAQSLGLATVDPTATDVVSHVTEWTGGSGADVAFEVSGAAGGVTAAVDALATRGRLVQVAIHPTPREVSLHRFFWRELTLVGARLYEREDFETAVALIAGGQVPAQALVSRTEPLDRAADAFLALESGAGVMKVLIDCRSAAQEGTR